MDGGAWRRRTAARGLCARPKSIGVASKPEDVVDFTRRSESKASEWLLSKPGTARVKVDRQDAAMPKVETDPDQAQSGREPRR